MKQAIAAPTCLRDGKWKYPVMKMRTWNYVAMKKPTACYWWSPFPGGGGVTGKVCVRNLAERVAMGQAGPWRKPSPRLSHCSGGVNLSGICWEPGGPVHRVYRLLGLMFEQRGHLHQSGRCRDAKTISGLRRCRGWAHPPDLPPSCPRSHKSVSLLALTRGCLETFRCKLWRPWGLRAARGQPTIKRKQQVK